MLVCLLVTHALILVLRGRFAIFGARFRDRNARVHAPNTITSALMSKVGVLFNVQLGKELVAWLKLWRIVGRETVLANFVRCLGLITILQESITSDHSSDGQYSLTIIDANHQIIMQGLVYFFAFPVCLASHRGVTEKLILCRVVHSNSLIDI